MDILKKLFPLSFKTKEKNVQDLIVNIIIYIVVAAIGGLIIGLLAKLPLIGFVFGLVGGIIDLYATIGIVLVVLVFLKVLK